MAPARLNLAEAFDRARACHGAGDVIEAERLYRAILAEQPDHGDALLLLGLIAQQSGQSDAALALIDRAIAAGVASAEVLSHRGSLLQALGRPDEALASFERALSLRPDSAETLSNRGVVLHQLRHFAAAVESYDEALALRPDFVDALANRGHALRALRRFEQALASYDAALALRPDQAEAHHDRANVLKDLRRYNEALAGYDRVLALSPDHAEAFNERGITLHELGQFEAALASYARALELRPALAAAYNNRGNTLRALQRFAEAAASYAQALELLPEDARVLSNRGVALHELALFEEELAAYAQAEASDPDLGEAQWNEALCRLLLGDFARAWPKYEWRWKTQELAAQQRHFATKLWLGRESLAGKTILLYADQGFGDAIQLCRYVPLVAAAGATIVLEVQAALMALFRDLAGVAQIKARGEALPDCDFHCPLLSLPLAFDTRLETIPPPDPYFQAAPERIDKMAALLPPGSSFRVGLVWSGRPAYLRDRLRSIPLELLDPLLALSGISYVSLQRDLRPEDEAPLACRPDILPLGPYLGDFADTAAAIALLDLVVTVDTAVAHLAGAMGKRVWILLPYVPDWRWLLDREDSPWYPAARLYRQPAPGDWNAVIAHVAAELARLVTIPETPPSQIGPRIHLS